MAKRKRKAKGPAPKIIGGHTYGSKKFGCYGKHVRSGKGRTKRARMFCRAEKKAGKK